MFAIGQKRLILDICSWFIGLFQTMFLDQSSRDSFALCCTSVLPDEWWWWSDQILITRWHIVRHGCWPSL